MASEPVRIERQTDGRHAVMDASGQVLGLHNSTWSAARQMHDYFGNGAAPAKSDSRTKPVTPGAPPQQKATGSRRRKSGTSTEHPPVPRPAPDNPPRHTAQRVTKRIPRP